jgi:hypothetical protein
LPAARETRTTTGLRAAERAYRTALDRDPLPATELSQILRTTEKQPDRDLELE